MIAEEPTSVISVGELSARIPGSTNFSRMKKANPSPRRDAIPRSRATTATHRANAIASAVSGTSRS
jgi:hypothetical protein